MIKRLAYEVLERNRGAQNVCVVGVWERGARIAEEMAAYISQIEGVALQAIPLDVNLFREPAQPAQAGVPAPTPNLDGQHVVLVDDVLFSGQTIRAALDAIKALGNPASVQLAVLIDRGHRTWPIQPDYCGRFIPTKHQEQISVSMEDEISVFLDE